MSNKEIRDVVVIDRQKWTPRALFGPNGTRCALGFAYEQLYGLSETMVESLRKGDRAVYPWLDRFAAVGSEIIAANDTRGGTMQDREDAITAYFAAIGITCVFVGKPLTTQEYFAPWWKVVSEVMETRPQGALGAKPPRSKLAALLKKKVKSWASA